MSVHIRYEAWLLMMGFLTGVGLMIVYDLFRLFRMAVRHNAFWVNVEDFGYWIYAGIMSFLLLYRENDGILRAYIIAAVFLGMGAYDLSISRIFFKLLKKCKKYIKMRKKQ